MKNPRLPNIAGDLSAAQQTELGDLEPLLARLAAESAPKPGPDETTRLLEHLRPLVAARAAPLPEWSQPEQNGVRVWLWLAWSQRSLFDMAFWWSCAGVLLVGLLVAWLGGGKLFAGGFVVVSPVLAAICVAYAFRPDARTLQELERISPVGPLELLYARLGLVLACNLLLACIAWSAIWVQEPRLVVWRLIVAWLGPMLLLAGAALYTAVRWGSVASVVAPLGVWAGLITLGVQVSDIPTSQRDTLGILLDRLNLSNSLVIGALLALTIGVLLLRQGGQIALKERPAWS